jgi:hypothetical protein
VSISHVTSKLIHWRTRSFGCVFSVIAISILEKERQMIGNTYDPQSKMTTRKNKLKREVAKKSDDWKQQRRKQRRMRQQEKEKRYADLSRRS